jgi:hypothetical protein
MAIYSDGAGNHFFGNCRYGAFNPSYPNIQYFEADTCVNFSADLAAICTAAGLPFRDIIPQASVDTWLANTTGPTIPNLANSLIHFGTAGDIDDRYCFSANFNGSTTTGSGGPVCMFNDSGSANTTNLMNESTNLLLRAEWPAWGSFTIAGGMVPAAWSRSGYVDGTYSPIYVCGVANSSSLALFFRQHRFVGGVGEGFISWFVYAGKMAEINTTSSYYNASNITQSVLFAGGNSAFSNVDVMPQINGRHYIGGAARRPLETDDARYPITCAGNQVATHAYVFDGSTAGTPAMGRASNLVLADGYYIAARPTKFAPNTFPDSGFNSWLPMGLFAGRTLLLRCYSTHV